MDQFLVKGAATFLEEPETSISILISTTVLHLDFFVMHSALPARPQLATGQESSICWSLTILRRKKERKQEPTCPMSWAMYSAAIMLCSPPSCY